MELDRFMDADYLSGILRARLGYYLVFSRMFDHEPDAYALQTICSSEFSSICDLLDGATQTLKNVQDIAQQEDAVEMLTREYTLLFLGPEKLPVPIWESVYFDRDSLLFTADTLSVRNAYRASGFISKGYPNMPDDHIATELSFLAELSQRACNAQESGNSRDVGETLQSQLTFLEQHLGRWIGIFSTQMQAVEGISMFYPSLASLASDFVVNDKEALQQLILD